MAQNKQTLRQRLDLLIEELIPTIRNAFFIAVQGVTSEVILIDLIKAIEQGDIQKAFRTLGMSDAALRPITAALEAAFERGGVTVGQSFPTLYAGGVRTVFRFDVRNTRAENWIREQSSRLITSIQEDTRVNIRNILTVNLEVGNNPRTTALDIVGRINPTTGRREGGIIGLNQTQEMWVRNARADLMKLDERYFTRKRRDKRFDSIVARAIKEGRQLPKETIDKLISRYKDNLLKLRGETIGRTETIQSLNRSEFEAYRQGVDLGAAKQSDVQKIWDDAGDRRVRHDHVLMRDQTVGLDEAFIAPDGSKMMFPGDASLGASAKEIINCRCKTRYNVDWLSDLD